MYQQPPVLWSYRSRDTQHGGGGGGSVGGHLGKMRVAVDFERAELMRAAKELKGGARE